MHWAADLLASPLHQVMVLTHEKERGRSHLSTKKLEPTPGDLLRPPPKVFDQADKMAAAFR